MLYLHSSPSWQQYFTCLCLVPSFHMSFFTLPLGSDETQISKAESQVFRCEKLKELFPVKVKISDPRIYQYSKCFFTFDAIIIIFSIIAVVDCKEITSTTFQFLKHQFCDFHRQLRPDPKSPLPSSPSYQMHAWLFYEYFKLN